MKKIMFALVAAAALLVGCQPKPVLVSSIKLSETTLGLVEGDSHHLSAIVSPKEATNPEVTWTSSNTAVATVTGSGDVKAVAPGEAKITVAATDGSGVTATCQVNVVKKVIPVSKIELNETAVTLKKGEDVQLTAVVTPSDATYQQVKWVTSDAAVATVEGGKVTAVAAGTANITAEATDESGIKSAACVVTVVEPKQMFVQYPSCLLRTGGKITQHVWYGSVDNYGEREDADGLTFKSDNESVATVDASGVVTSVAPGKATITVSDATGSTVTFVVNVEDKPARQYDDYLPGISLWDCHDGSLAWNKNKTTYSLKDGYVDGAQCMGATIKNYKIAELYFPKKVDVSSIKNPALFIRMYISDPSKLTTAVVGDEPLIEIRSTGEVSTEGNPYPYVETNDRYFWRMQDIFKNWDNAKPSAKQTLVAGWNNIVLPFDQAALQNGDKKAFTYFRMYQMHGQASYNEVEFRFDQIRVIDWTEFELCDNFAMWRDRPAQQNQYQYVNDTQGKAEGAGCIACEDVLFSAVNCYRLEMWPGLDYAMPACYDYDDLKLQLKFFVADDDLAFFNDKVHFRVEVGSKTYNAEAKTWSFTPDNNAIEMSIGATTADPLNLKSGWNTMEFDFSKFKSDIKGNFDVRNLGYFRIIFTPLNTSNADVNYRTYKLDEIRIVKK